MQHLGHVFASYLRALRFNPGGALLKFSVLNQTSHFNKHTAFLLSIKIKTASEYKFKIFFNLTLSFRREYVFRFYLVIQLPFPKMRFYS